MKDTEMQRLRELAAKIKRESIVYNEGNPFMEGRAIAHGEDADDLESLLNVLEAEEP